MRILIVDDEFVSLTKMKKMLSGVGRCDTASGGKDGYRMYSQALTKGDPYDLITIDIEMPIMNGFELLELITRHEQRLGLHPIKKIMVSAGGTYENVFNAGAKQIDSFIVKPLKRDILAKKLYEHKMIEEPELPTSAAVEEVASDTPPKLSAKEEREMQEKLDSESDSMETKFAKIVQKKFRGELETAVWKAFRTAAGVEVRLVQIKTRKRFDANLFYSSEMIDKVQNIKVTIGMLGTQDGIRRTAANMKGGIMEKLEEGAMDSFQEIFQEIQKEVLPLFQHRNFKPEVSPVSVEWDVENTPNDKWQLMINIATMKNDLFILGLLLEPLDLEKEQK